MRAVDFRRLARAPDTLPREDAEGTGLWGRRRRSEGKETYVLRFEALPLVVRKKKPAQFGRPSRRLQKHLPMTL